MNISDVLYFNPTLYLIYQTLNNTTICTIESNQQHIIDYFSVCKLSAKAMKADGSPDGQNMKRLWPWNYLSYDWWFCVGGKNRKDIITKLTNSINCADGGKQRLKISKWSTIKIFYRFLNKTRLFNEFCTKVMNQGQINSENILKINIFIRQHTVIDR